MSDIEKFSCPRRLLPDTVDTWRNGSSCSFCGSLHPDVFMERALAGTITLGPTDKAYKVYVEATEGTDKLDTVKFYFTHLSEAQQDEFIAALNAKTLNVGYPGYFYALPFFIGLKDK